MTDDPLEVILGRFYNSSADLAQRSRLLYPDPTEEFELNRTQYAQEIYELFQAGYPTTNPKTTRKENNESAPTD